MSEQQEIVVIEPGNGTIATQYGGSVKKFGSRFERASEDTYDDLPSGNGHDRGTPITVDLGKRGRWNIGLDGIGGERLMGVGRYTDPIWAELVVKAALSKHTQLLRLSENPVVRLGVSAPYAYLKGIGTGAVDVEKVLTKSMRGTFDVPYGKKIVPVRISSVKVRGEGLIGFAYLAYDKDMKLKDDYRGTNTLVLDIGLDTINTALFVGTQPHIDTVKSPPWGINELYKAVGRDLDQTQGRVYPDQVEAMILAGDGTAEQKKVISSRTQQYLENLIRYVDIVEGVVHKPVHRIAVFGGAVKVIPNIKDVLNLRDKFALGDEFTNVRGLNLLSGGTDDWDTSDV